MGADHHRRPYIQVPLWLGIVYTGLSLALVPWAFYLASTLPAHHLSSHWDLSWVGLDFGITFLLLLSALLVYLKSDWVIISSTAAGSLLIADAWFDVMSAHPGSDLRESVAMAVFVELPLAAISLIAAHRIVQKNQHYISNALTSAVAKRLEQVPVEPDIFD